MAHWVSMRYGISYWKASRWIAASHALEKLPGISDAFAGGALSIDKVVTSPGSPPVRPNQG
jgi:hypothetical protein